MKKTILAVSIAIVVIIVGIVIVRNVLTDGKMQSTPEVHKSTTLNIDDETGKIERKKLTNTIVSKRLEGISELCTAQMKYTGLITVSEGTIPFITKKGFSMAYSAEVKAGIDMRNLMIEVTDDKVVIQYPAAEIVTLHVLPESLKFYDERKALLNKDSKSDVSEAIVEAEKDLKENSDMDDLLALASGRAELVFNSLLSDLLDGRELVLKQGGIS